MQDEDVGKQDPADTTKTDTTRADTTKQGSGFDYDRYYRLLREADGESKRLALIELLIEEKARDRLAAQRASDRAAMTAQTIATVLRAGRSS
jgi:hypothetical protein